MPVIVRMPQALVDFCDMEAKRLGYKNKQAYIIALIVEDRLWTTK